MDNEPVKPKKSPVWALILGFMPAALALAAFAIAALLDLKSGQAAVLLLLAVAGGLVCAFTASVMLFRRRTGLAIFTGIVLLVLNFVIAFFFGCLALLSNASF